jgi:hypothetical protein
MSECPEGVLEWLDRNGPIKGTIELRYYITQLEASLAEAKADSKRLDKLLNNGCFTFIHLKGEEFVIKVGPLHGREEIDQLDNKDWLEKMSESCKYQREEALLWSARD